MAIELVDVEALIASVPGVEQGRHENGRVVSLPGTIEQAAAVVRCVHDAGLTLEIAGAGTKRGWGGPVHADLMLGTARLSGVREHRWQDLTATVGAGTPWAEMQDKLAHHGQFVALDPLWPKQATVGGVIAVNDSGALRLSYGSLRDLVIGMTIVLADGTIAKTGGKVVKNVAGYDLHKLMTGAFGTLGLIAEATFRLHPLPAKTEVWSAMSPDVEALGFLMTKVQELNLSVRAMQLRASALGYALDIELASLPEILEQQMERLDVLARSWNGACKVTPRATHELFTAREQVFGQDVVAKVTMLPGAIAGLSRDVVQLGGTAVTQAVGIMVAGFREKTAASALSSLQEYAERARGSVTILKADKLQQSSWTVPPRSKEGGLKLMRELKRQFDAKRTLNPGRFMGGI